MITFKDGFPVLATQIWRPVDVVFEEGACAGHQWAVLDVQPHPWYYRREERCGRCGAMRWVSTYLDELKRKYGAHAVPVEI